MNRRLNRCSVVVIGVFCSMLSYGTWPTYHGNASLSGVSGVAVGNSLTLAWRTPSGGRVDTTPVSDGERIFCSIGKGRILALDLAGKKRWEKAFTRMNDAGQEMALRFEAPMVCFDGLVFAGSTRGTLFALDAANGGIRWQYETGGVIVGSPNRLMNRADALIVLDQGAGALHCVDIKTGKQRWKTEGVERCDGAPGVNESYIAFGSCQARLHVYAQDGTHLKDIDVGGDAQIAGGVVLDGTRAFAGVRDGGLLCFDLEKGDVVWSSDESQEPTFATPAVTESMVVYASDNGFVYAVKKEDGATVWSFETGGIPYSPVVAGDKVVVSADGRLYLLNLKTGTKQWSKELSDEITSPALINGLVVVGADDGTIRAMHTPDPEVAPDSSGDES